MIEKINERKIQIIKESGYKIPTNDLNPVYKVATALQDLKPNKSGAVIKIKKNIPTFSGLNSQAGNAAGVLRALNGLWKFGLSEKELVKIAEKIDQVIAKIMKLKHKNHEKVILVLPKYIKIDSNWMASKKSPYEKVAFRNFPDLKEIADILKKAGCKKCGMSGKGPMLYGFSDEKIDKKALKRVLNNKTEFVWIK